MNCLHDFIYSTGTYDYTTKRYKNQVFMQKISHGMKK